MDLMPIEMLLPFYGLATHCFHRWVCLSELSQTALTFLFSITQ